MRNRFCLGVLVGFLALLVSLKSGWGQSPATLFVLNKRGASVWALNAETGQRLYKLRVGVGPHEAATSPDGKWVVVANYGGRTPGNSLSLIDVARKKIARTLSLGDYHRPHGIAFFSDGKRIAVTAEAEKVLLIVDIEKGEVLQAISTGQERSHMVVLSPDGSRAYVANIDSGSISVLDLNKNQLKKNIPTGPGAEGLALLPKRKELWVTNRQTDTVSVLNTETLQVVKTIPVKGFPIRAAATPDEQFVLVSAARAGEVVVLDVSEKKILRRLPSQRAKAKRSRPFPIGILIPPQGSIAYVANSAADNLSVLDLSRWKIVKEFATGPEPDGMAWAGN